MKRILTFLLTFFISGISFAQTSDSVYMFSYFRDNGQDGLHLAYSHDGYKFIPLKNDGSFLRPVLSKDKLMRDPCIIRGADNQFHMVWTVSWNDKGIGYSSSKDLVNWTEQQYFPVMAHEPGAKNAWAPEITYDQKIGQYIIYWASTVAGKFAETDSMGDGPYNHRMYYVTTRDFKSFSPTSLLYDQGFNVIDASIQANGDEYLLFLKDETKRPFPEKNIRIATSKDILKGYGKPSKPITGDYWAEGPTVTKIGNQWVVYFDKYINHQYGAVASQDLVNWTDISAKISFPKGTRHGTVFTISKAELAQLLK